MPNPIKNPKIKAAIASSAFSASLFLMNLTPVQAITFQWSFSNNGGGIDGEVAGILDVPEGNNVSATSVILTSTTNPIFENLIGFDFVTLPNFANQFNISGRTITAAQFSTDFNLNDINLNLELNSDVFGDDLSQNQGLFTIAGNPLEPGLCPENCLQTFPLFEANVGQTEFAPTFAPVPESSPVLGLLAIFGLMGINQLRKTVRR
jgi:hypothetical protein